MFHKLSKQQIIYTSLLFVAFAFSCWLLFINQPKKNRATAENPHRVDMFMQDVISMRTDLDGKPKYELRSPMLIHHPFEDTIELTTPHFIIYKEPSKPPWHVTAKNGTSKFNMTIIRLWNDVKMHQKTGTDNTETTLLTSSIILYPKKSFAETAEPVIAIQPDSVIQAVGMRAYLDKEQIELLSQAQGHFKAKEKSHVS